MIVEDFEKKFYELKGKLDVGVITEEQFKSEVAQLRFQDSEGRWWMIGAQSGKWYVLNGTRWIPGVPPRDIPSPTPAQEPRKETTQTIEPIITPHVAAPPPKPESTYPPLPASSMAEPLAPEHIPHSQMPPMKTERAKLAPVTRRPVALPTERRMSLPRFSVSGPMLIVGAGILAIIGVIVFWIILDNFVPNKPISTFMGNLTGTKPSTPVAIGTPASTLAREVPLMLSMGDSLLAQSQIDSAITQYQNAAQLAPTNAVPLTRLASALAFKGQTQEAVNKAQLAVQRGPTDSEAHAQFCRALAWNGQGNDALVLCDKAVQLDNKNINAHAFRAEAYLFARRMTDAQASAQAALQLGSQNVEALRAQAWVLTLQGGRENALAAWQLTVAQDPNLFFRHYEFAEVLRVYFNRPSDAVAEYQKSLSLYGAYLPAISRLGQAYLALNRPQDAIPQFRRALTLDPNNAEHYAYLGVAYGQANQCTQATPYFDQALKLDPNNAIAQSGANDCKNGKSPTLAPLTPPNVPLVVPTIVPPKQ